MPHIIHTIAEWREVQHSQQIANSSIGLVMTMGNLHRGHQSLLQRCRHENDISVLSIFVNPAQFNEKADLDKYPRTLEQDLAIAQAENVDYVIVPTPAEMYPDEYIFKVVGMDGYSQMMEGKHRPGHFDGMLTIVLKMHLVVRPVRSYFGEKDYQQFVLAKNMLGAFLLETEVIPCPTIREADNFAMSSRNSRLNSAERILAAEFPKLLAADMAVEDIKSTLESRGFLVEYIEEHQGRRYGAVRLGDVRLIDNITIQQKHETSLFCQS